MAYTDVYKLIQEVPPFKWEETVDEMTEEERSDMARQLNGLACRAVELGSYIEKRYGYGCGDQGHKSAVKYCNKRGKKVWVDVMGYNFYLGLTI